MELILEMRGFMVLLLGLAVALAKPSMDDEFSAKLKAAEMGHYPSMGKQTYDDDEEATVSVDNNWDEIDDHHIKLGDGKGGPTWDALEISDDEGVTSDFYQSFMVAEMADILMDSPLNTEEGVEGRFLLCKKCMKKYVVCKNICKSLSTINNLTSDMVPCSTTCLQRLSACCFKKFTATKSAITGGLSSLFGGKQTSSSTQSPPVSATPTAEDSENLFTKVYRNPFNLDSLNKLNQGSRPSLFQNVRNPFQQGAIKDLFQHQNTFPWAVPSFQGLNPFQNFPAFPKPNIFGNDNSQTVVITSTIQVLVSTCQFTTDPTATSIPEESESPTVVSPDQSTPTSDWMTENTHMPTSVSVDLMTESIHLPTSVSVVPAHTRVPAHHVPVHPHVPPHA